MSLTPEERYSRQVLFHGIGAAGQESLRQAQVAIVGCGATGSTLAGLLARAGVGTLRIIDRDYVEPSNLQRQALFDEADAAESLPKAIAAARKIAAFNSDIVVEPHVADLTPANIEELLSGAQQPGSPAPGSPERPDVGRSGVAVRAGVARAGVNLILDGTDNFETRYLVNDYAVRERLPWIYAAAVGSYGVTMNVLPGETACLACVFPESPRGSFETCDTAGILNAAASTVAAIVATEALKFLVGARQTMRNTLLSFDLWRNERSEIGVQSARADCRACAKRDFVYLAGEGRAHITLCGRNSVQIHERQRPIDFGEITRRLEPHGAVRHNEFVLKFWREPYEITLFPDGRAIIKGTTDTAVARSLYARFIGS
jgi:adenylyltransferase/sulfurtransferase